MYIDPAAGSLILQVLIAGVLGPGPRNQIIAIIFILVPYMARVVRTQVTTLRNQDFVEAARATGAGAREIIGHLVDSATNNHQRFVRGQLQDDLVFPG